MNARTGPLSDVRVLDLTQALAGPYCTMLLADLGADVIKVEPPAGDMSRSLGPLPADRKGCDYGGYFASVNRNKRSVVLDIKTDADRETFLQAGADGGRGRRECEDWRDGSRGNQLRAVARNQTGARLCGDSRLRRSAHRRESVCGLARFRHRRAEHGRAGRGHGSARRRWLQSRSRGRRHLSRHARRAGSRGCRFMRRGGPGRGSSSTWRCTTRFSR